MSNIRLTYINLIEDKLTKVEEYVEHFSKHKLQVLTGDKDLNKNTDIIADQSYSERQLYEAALERLTREVAAVDGVEEEKAQVKVGAVLDSKAA